jgi:hypothetical protein
MSTSQKKLRKLHDLYNKHQHYSQFKDVSKAFSWRTESVKFYVTACECHGLYGYRCDPIPNGTLYPKDIGKVYQGLIARGTSEAFVAKAIEVVDKEVGAQLLWQAHYLTKDNNG